MLDDATFSTQGLGALNLALALIVFSVALHLRRDDLRRVLRHPRVLAVGLCSQWLLLPVLTVLLVLALRPAPAIAAGMLLVAACPGGAMSNFFALVARGNAVLSVALTSLATLGAAVLTPLLFAAGMQLAGNGGATLTVPLAAMLQLLGWTVALPLAAGVCLQWAAPALAERLRRPSRALAGLLLAGIIAVGLFSNRELALAASFAPLLVLVMAHNALALAGGWLLARASGCPPAEVRAITLETGIQNAGLGLILIFNFYPGEDAMTILVATWGVWHLVAGALLAHWWRRRIPHAPAADAAATSD